MFEWRIEYVPAFRFLRYALTSYSDGNIGVIKRWVVLTSLSGMEPPKNVTFTITISMMAELTDTTNISKVI